MIAIDDHVVLHVVKVRGLASAEQLAVSLGSDLSDVQSVLTRATDDELVRYREGRVTGYALTAAGRERYQLLHADAVPAEVQARLGAAYDAFLEPNREFKQVTTDWQLREDGADAAPILARLDAIDAQLASVLSSAADGDPRFEAYAPRFAAALARIHAGDETAFARPMSESYHDVWMELHEDLIASLGRERTDADE